MSARANFLLSAGLAALPLAAAIFGLARLLGSIDSSEPVTPIAGVCQLAYEQTLDRAGHLGVALLLAIVFLFTARAIYVLGSAWRRTASVGRAISASPVGVRSVIDRVSDVIPRGVRIGVVEAAAPFALTLGYLKTRVILSSGLVDVLDDTELEAVIRHELVHASRRDPLRVLFAEFFRAGLPFVPALAYLLEQFSLRKEIEADAAVVDSMRSPAPLASALSKVLVASEKQLGLLGAGLSPTEARIDALLGRVPTRSSGGKVALLSLVSCLSLMLMSIALFVLFSSPSTIVKHICWPASL